MKLIIVVGGFVGVICCFKLIRYIRRREVRKISDASIVINNIRNQEAIIARRLLKKSP